MGYFSDEQTVKEYASYDDFLKRDDKTINGYLKGEPKPHLIDCEGCWNCYACNDCYNCNSCYRASDCDDCTTCNNVINCSDCNDIGKVINFTNNKHFMLQ